MPDVQSGQREITRFGGWRAYLAAKKRRGRMSATSTGTILGRTVLPAVEDGKVPFWRLVLRGCSQCCFQTNEITGALFLIAVLTYKWQQFVLFLMAAVISQVVAIALRADRALLELGLYGFNVL